jgi:hypothetical protein
MPDRKGAEQMAKPTYEDAALIVQLAQWGSASGVDEAKNWLRSDQFTPDPKEFVEKYPPGSEGQAHVAKVGAWFETVGTLYKHGLLNEELLFDWLAVDFVWERVKALALWAREQTGDEAMFENFEAMAKAQKG